MGMTLAQREERRERQEKIDRAQEMAQRIR
jgi:hypothetical protein